MTKRPFKDWTGLAAVAGCVGFSGCMGGPPAAQPDVPKSSTAAPADKAGNQAPRLIDLGAPRAVATPGIGAVALLPDPPRSEGLHDLAVIAPRPALGPFEAVGPYAIFNRAPDLVPFASKSLTGTDFDVFIYDQTAGTVLVPPGINTTANEVDPQISTNGRWMVYSTDADGTGLSIHMLDVGLGQIDTLSTLNTGVPTFGPAVDDTGRLVAFRVRANEHDQLRLYSLISQRTFVPPALNVFQDGQLSDFTLAPTGTLVALTVTPDANTTIQDI
ncbi:MAG: hypothetical protein JWM80_1053, partial [Cyanobacteria bacterium RYN_339]|nr:hypothetical protein [Cyanobacteria bacterium RYN_339]